MMESLSKQLKMAKTPEEKGRAAILAKRELMELLVNKYRGYISYTDK